VQRLGAQGADVFVKHLRQVNQAALARAILPVLQDCKADRGIFSGSSIWFVMAEALRFGQLLRSLFHCGR
jgi:hypothetical protein